MIRRFNYTGRRRIYHSDCKITVIERPKQSPYFNIDISNNVLTSVDPESEIIIESYLGPRVMRFFFGSAGRIQKPDNLQLSSFRKGEVPFFRLKIVEKQDTNRKLIAWADRIRPTVVDELGKPKRSILPVIPKDLGDEIWRLEFIDEINPQLLVNSSVSRIREVSSIVENDADFKCLSFPAILRSILSHLILDGETASSLNEDDDWIRFAKGIVGQMPSDIFNDEEEDFEARKEWIERVVAGFCGKLSVLDVYCEFKS